jgi:hypothetical protein
VILVNYIFEKLIRKIMGNLFVNWLKIELKTKKLGVVLDDLNTACGTKYKHNWPSIMKKREYGLNHLPTKVRQYMMVVVLPEKLGSKLSEKEINKLVISLT